MRGKFSFGIGLLAFAAAGAGSAVAADIAVRPMGAPPPLVAVPAAVPEWVGFYIGINGGGGGAHNSFDPQFSDSLFFSGIPPIIGPFSATVSSVLPPNLSSNGGVFGAQAGYNWQWGPVVGGLEIDFDGADIHGSSAFVEPNLFGVPVSFTHDFKIDELASVRARLGYLIFPNWLLYGTAGLGYGHTRFNSSATWSPFSFLSFSQFSEADQNLFGWVVGAGLEWQFFPHWLLRGEYLHYDFGRVTEPEVTGLFLLPTGNVNVRTTVDIGRAALSYKF
jgi:opacity protein-like surface antigen